MKNSFLIRKTKRLIVRPLTIDDFDVWKEAFLSVKKSQNKWDFGPKPKEHLTKLAFKKILKRREHLRKNDHFYDIGIFLKSGELIGNVSAMEVSRGISHTAYLGYYIFNTQWGHGYAKEAVRAMLDIGFRDLKLHRMEAGIEPKNLRSIALAKSLKMRREGLETSPLFTEKMGGPFDVYTDL